MENVSSTLRVENRIKLLNPKKPYSAKNIAFQMPTHAYIVKKSMDSDLLKSNTTVA